ncbi:aminotransferase class V-fold PLP-dependent enzyme [Alkalihalobacillus sp. AL-G]|uniref:aminotransferase class V-fold PLP-dependent enzyme n=1 Tax=Alkalihalobacillus sp. AL-G TaxID=2926399 RepID=UPI00272A110B|nr:aminotransferase class V-fold PLP-dependent enzyme [Alkalihalobacillus sp. AL-G]WLD94315.1 aminotransferase class V-fold PLP-dependent enzyme [Alkalihalobacillus sp. AL-G]
MNVTSPLIFKIATDPKEFEQIHQLNYQTFVDEIPQHESNDTGHLIDKFDDENTYIICLNGDKLVGMMAVRAKRPFSLDKKLVNLESYLPKNRSICEIRLLAVQKSYRNGRVFFNLSRRLIEFCNDNGFDLAIISGTVREQKLYRHLGFVPFGPLVGEDDAQFQPMFLTREAFEQKGKLFWKIEERSQRKKKVNENFLPGPVKLRKEVLNAFQKEPVSHRANTFLDEFEQTKERLLQITNAKHVEILLGTGTLGNDVVAGQLALLNKHGLILVNGEFGERLVDYATRFGLSFQTVEYEWGQSFDREEIEEVCWKNPDIRWIWAVHCETSTGLLNDMEMLKAISANGEYKLCLDCCSSLGSVPVNLEGVYLASSGSGKALGSFAGLSFVFYNHKVKPDHSIPRYIDLGYYREKGGVPFTHSSNLVHALNTAITNFERENVYEKQQELADWLKQELTRNGFRIIGTSPSIVTIALSHQQSSGEIGEQLDNKGYQLSYRSDYLIQKNWIQIALMGHISKEKIIPLLDELCIVAKSPTI